MTLSLSFPRLVVLPRHRVEPAQQLCRPIAGPRASDDPSRSVSISRNYQRAGRALFADVHFLALKRRWSWR